MAAMCVLGMVRSTRRLTACDGVVYVSVIKHDKFRQSWLDSGWCFPQFLDRVVDISITLRDMYAQCYTVLFWTGY